MAEDEGSPCILMVGDIFEGFRFIGPFFDFAAADTWAQSEANDVKGQWQIVPLEKPVEP